MRSQIFASARVEEGKTDDPSRAQFYGGDGEVAEVALIYHTLPPCFTIPAASWDPGKHC